MAAEGRWQLCEVTAYAGNCPLCETTGVTANGTATSDRPYGIAASPGVRLGSHVYVPAGAGYLDRSAEDRWFTVDDRGGALRTEWRRSGITRLDLRYRTHASAKAFGRKLMMVYIQERP
jgi:3D (Asp-Asp-Asp) domain-containing protein